MSIKVFVVDVDGKSMPMDISPHATVSVLKALIGFSGDEYGLFTADVALDDEKTIAECNIANFQTIHVTTRQTRG